MPRGHPPNASRIAMACKAMKEFGIADRRTKPALKHLLELYENNWDFIEAESYKVVLDYIVPDENKPDERVQPKIKGPLMHESKRAKSKNKQAPYDSTEVIGLPNKRYCTRQQKAQSVANILKRSPPRPQPVVKFEEESEDSEDTQPLVRKPRQRHINLQEDLVSENNVDLVPGDFPELQKSSNLICEGNFTNFNGCGAGEDVMKYLQVGLLNESTSASVPDRFQIDVAPSSPVKNAFVASFSQNSGFDLSNSEVSQQMMDGKCIKSYRTGECFSMAVATNVTGKKTEVGIEVRDMENARGESAKRLRISEGRNPSNKVGASCNYHSSLRVARSRASNIDDITRGEERFTIPLENGGNEELPTFFYTVRNLIYNKASLRFTLANISEKNCCSECYGDCLVSSVPCHCVIANGGECAYTLGGLVKDKFLEECISMKREPKKHAHMYCKKCPFEKSVIGKRSVACNGHLIRRFIKECWYKCGCEKRCGNRIVQNGIVAKLQVFLTPEGKGWGLRTLEALPRGVFVCEFVGEVVTIGELHERNLSCFGKEHSYQVLLDADWGSQDMLKDEKALCLDTTVYGNVARFINHRCSDATLVEIPVEVETPDHHYYHVALFTTRDIGAMEELTWDYGITFNDHDYHGKPFQCLCGSPFCRDRNDSKCEIIYVRRKRKDGKDNKKDGLLEHLEKDLDEATPREEIQVEPEALMQLEVVMSTGALREEVQVAPPREETPTPREEIQVEPEASMQLEVVPSIGAPREQVQLAPHASKQLEIVPSMGALREEVQEAPRSEEIQVESEASMQLEVVSYTGALREVESEASMQLEVVPSTGALREEVQVAPHASKQLEIALCALNTEIQNVPDQCMQPLVIPFTPQIEPRKAMDCSERELVTDRSSFTTALLSKEVADLRARLEAEKAAREKDFEAHRAQFQAVLQQLSTLLPGFQVLQAPLQMQHEKNVDDGSHMSLG